MIYFVTMFAALKARLMKTDLFFSISEEIMSKKVNYNPLAVMPTMNHEQNIDRDQAIVSRLDRMIATAPNEASRRMWEVKRAEFARSLRWKALEDYATGTSRINARD